MKFIGIIIVVLFVLEGAGYWAYKASQEKETPSEDSVQVEDQVNQDVSESSQEEVNEEENILGRFEVIDLDDPANKEKYADLLSLEVIEYPLIQMEEVDGVTERTIHMGVRQWAWDPSELEVNLGEKVRLIIHNADVVHTIEIPELGVSMPIPEEGAVVEFMADKKGTFEFVCGAPYCGEGHDRMRGKFVIS